MAVVLWFSVWPCMHHSVVSQLSDHVVCSLTSELNKLLMPINFGPTVSPDYGDIHFFVV